MCENLMFKNILIVSTLFSTNYHLYHLYKSYNQFKVLYSFGYSVFGWEKISLHMFKNMQIIGIGKNKNFRIYTRNRKCAKIIIFKLVESLNRENRFLMVILLVYKVLKFWPLSLNDWFKNNFL